MVVEIPQSHQGGLLVEALQVHRVRARDIDDAKRKARWEVGKAIMLFGLKRADGREVLPVTTTRLREARALAEESMATLIFRGWPVMKWVDDNACEEDWR